MATYAAVVSLINTMDAIMNHPLLSTCFAADQIQSLGKKLGLLLHFIENSYDDEESECLLRKIAHAAHAAEDVIESYIVDQIHAGALQEGPSFLIDLHSIVLDIDRVKEEVVKLKEKRRRDGGHPQPARSYSKTAAASSQPAATTVGFEFYLNQLLDCLTGVESLCQVIPIVGMGGVGKTTLARSAYENSLIVQYFDVRAWLSVSVSQQCNARTLLMQLLSSLGESTLDIHEKVDDHSIGERLHDFLFGRRYLIILDDMWSFQAWNMIKYYLPVNQNSSRIVVTTRLLEVAHGFVSLKVLELGLLNDSKSWELFCCKAFIEGGCPVELEETGRRIVKKCRGLPLSIVVIGSVLGKFSRDKECWEKIANNLSPILNSAEYKQCLDILFSSYKHLPVHLKPCFLHLGIFPEGHEINVSQVIKLWIAEGFIKPNKDKSLEEVAEGYIYDLFERSLILVDSLGWDMKFETFHIHNLVRDLCLREVEKEKFLCITRRIGNRQGIDRQRRIVIRQRIGEAYEYDLHTLRSTSNARSLVCEWGEPILESRLLRVVFMNIRAKVLYPSNAFHQVNMRLIAYRADILQLGDRRELPRSMFQLWNLQSLIFSNSEVEVPVEIWKLPHLRHVDFVSISLTEPRSGDDQFVLHSLQTLMTVRDLRFSEEVCRRIPNIKVLHVSYWDEGSDHDHDHDQDQDQDQDYCLQNVGRLSKLESLIYSCDEMPDHNHLLQKLTFPTSLKKLSLCGCRLDWYDDMEIIGGLPNLEALQLHGGSFVGGEWNSVEGGFLRLKYLRISSVLDEWNAESSHFPVLHTLYLLHLFDLDEIPPGIGDIATLRVIRVDACGVSTAVSAMRILEEQEAQGNDDLRVQLGIRGKEKREEFFKVVEQEGITCRNFKLE